MLYRVMTLLCKPIIALLALLVVFGCSKRLRLGSNHAAPAGWLIIVIIVVVVVFQISNRLT
jgi:hypothetical protein